MAKEEEEEEIFRMEAALQTYSIERRMDDDGERYSNSRTV